MFYLWTRAEENPGWILQYDIQLCHQIKPRQKKTIVSQFLLICRLLLPVCTQLSQLYQSTIFNAGVKFHITREKPKVKVQSCSLMWRSRCVKKNWICPYLVRRCEIFQQKNHLCGQACKTTTRNRSCAQNSLLKNQKRLQHVDSSCATGRNKKLGRQSSG